MICCFFSTHVCQCVWQCNCHNTETVFEFCSFSCSVRYSPRVHALPRSSHWTQFQAGAFLPASLVLHQWHRHECGELIERTFKAAHLFRHVCLSTMALRHYMNTGIATTCSSCSLTHWPIHDPYMNQHVHSYVMASNPMSLRGATLRGIWIWPYISAMMLNVEAVLLFAFP